MVDDYIRVYERLLARGAATSAVAST
jgi:hypothetical protein